MQTDLYLKSRLTWLTATLGLLFRLGERKRPIEPQQSLDGRAGPTASLLGGRETVLVGDAAEQRGEEVAHLVDEDGDGDQGHGDGGRDAEDA